MEHIKSYFRDWSRFEKCWICTSSLVIVTLSVLWGDSPLALISSLAGILSVVLAAKGKLENYGFGMVQVLTYAYICYQAGMYGSMVYSLLMVPMDVIGVLSWRRNLNEEGREVRARKLAPKARVLLTAGIALTILAVTGILRALGGNYTLADSASSVLNIIAMILMLARYQEQWVLWILVNLVSIALWASAIQNGTSGGITILVMWSAFLLNSIYGYRNWKKLTVK